MIVGIIFFIVVVAVVAWGIYAIVTLPPPKEITVKDLYPKEINVTVQKKDVTGKNMLWQDIHTVLGTKGELFHVDDYGYFTVDPKKTYIFMCQEYEIGMDSCIVKEEILNP